MLCYFVAPLFSNMWQCTFAFCVFSAISLPILLSHLNQVHSDDDFKLICGLGDTPDCKRVQRKYNSFYRHIRRKHDDVYKGHAKPPADGDYFIVPNEETEHEEHCASFISAEEETHLSEAVAGEMDVDSGDEVEDFQLKTREHAILFLER